MRKSLVILAVVLGTAALGYEQLLTKLVSSGSSVSYTATGSLHTSIQCDAAAFVEVGPTGTTADADGGVLVQANAPPYDILLDSTAGVTTVAEIPVTGSNTCKLFRVYP